MVWFPTGVYQANPKTSGAAALRLRIRSSGVVLRGEGSDTGGSVLYMEDEIQPENPAKMWSGRPVLLAAPAERTQLIQKGEVVGAVAMDPRRVPVKPGHSIKPGDRVVLTNKVSGREIESVSQWVAPHTWLPEWTGRITIQELHEVDSVGVDFVVLRDVLLAPIKADQKWTLNAVCFIHHIGIENLRFRGNWLELFVHHKDWRCDSAWKSFFPMSKIAGRGTAFSKT